MIESFFYEEQALKWLGNTELPFMLNIGENVEIDGYLYEVNSRVMTLGPEGTRMIYYLSPYKVEA